MTTKQPDILIMQYFTYDHLPDGFAKEVSKECCKLARFMDDDLIDGPEKAAGLRKLLEAKDCFVRSAIGEGG